MSFGESIFSVGFIQKIIKGDQNVKLNRTYPSHKQLQKVLEDTRSHATEADIEGMIGGAGRSPIPTSQPSASYVGSPSP